MNSSVVFALVALSMATTFAQNFVNVVDQAETVAPSTDDDSTRDALGVVYGTRPCGGPGQLIEWRIESCDTTDSPCRFPTDGELRRTEIDFVPSQDIEQLGVRLIFTLEGKKPVTVFDKPVRNSTVAGGQQYTKKSAGGISKELQGKNATVQYILYRASEEEMPTEICAEADFQFV